MKSTFGEQEEGREIGSFHLAADNYAASKEKRGEEIPRKKEGRKKSIGLREKEGGRSCN